jgi:hypothetical protein
MIRWRKTRTVRQLVTTIRHSPSTSLYTSALNAECAARRTKQCQDTDAKNDSHGELHLLTKV